MNYYNEFDPKAAAWLRELIKEGHIAPGDVDERSIADVKAHELKNYIQCHFFAGIGGWSKALRLARIGDDERRDTGSCPCQPFSDAGEGKAEADPRHLWPAWFDIIRERRPDAIYGEQVASKAALKWWDGVQADLESAGYAAVAFDLCSAGVGAPTIRQRLFWVAYTLHSERRPIERSVEAINYRPDTRRQETHRIIGARRQVRGLANIEGEGRTGMESQCEAGQRERSRTGGDRTEDIIVPRGSGFVVPFERLGDAFQSRLEGYAGHERHGDEPGRLGAQSPGSVAAASRTVGFWDRFDLCLCTDGKARRIEPGSFPLVAGLPGRVGLLRGYGNGINVEAAARFIEIAEESFCP